MHKLISLDEDLSKCENCSFITQKINEQWFIINTGDKSCANNKLFVNVIMKKIIYTINTILILIDIILLVFIFVILYFYFWNTAQKLSKLPIVPNTQVIISLDKVINQNDLGEFLTDNLSNPTAQQIKEKVKELNPQIDITKIKVENITNNSATIYSTEPSFYSGTVKINYTISLASINW